MHDKPQYDTLQELSASKFVKLTQSFEVSTHNSIEVPLKSISNLLILLSKVEYPEVKIGK